jgi:hypothetical protein
MADNNTVIENVEYFNMDESKNSWYFGAEKFDPSFPLAYSYKDCRVSEEIYNYFNVVSEYYKVQKDVYALIVESRYPNGLANFYVDGDRLIEYSDPPTDSEFEIIEKDRVSDPFRYESDLSMGRYFFPGRKLMFSLRERINNVFYTRFVFCTEFDGSAGELKSKYFTSPATQLIPDRGFPYLQTIATQDWDLVKRYFFFMIRNHQYEHAEIVYFEDENNLDPDHENPIFISDVDTIEELFRTLPSDIRVSDKIRKHRQVVFYEPIKRFERYAIV